MHRALAGALALALFALQALFCAPGWATQSTPAPSSASPAASMPAASTTAPSTTAPTSAALQPPSEVADVLSAVRLQGRANLRFLGLLVYEARLWAGSGFTADRYEGHPFALELQYARKLDGAAIAERSIVEMRRSGELSDAQAQAWQADLTRAFPDVVPGDRLTGVYAPGAPTRFFHNGRQTATLADPAFARSFFGIWLATTTSEPRLRKQLIGAGS